MFTQKALFKAFKASSHAMQALIEYMRTKKIGN
jgi:hypothetical protein